MLEAAMDTMNKETDSRSSTGIVPAFQNIVEKARNGVVMVDRSGIVLVCNKTARMILGKSAEQVLRKHMGDI
jgi:transcriptional regulator with PAS, ATPase and Fis domain